MFKLLASVLALVLVFSSGAAVAQTIGVYAQPLDQSTPLSPRITATSGQIQVVVVAEGFSPDIFAYEFTVPLLNLVNPTAILKVGETVFGAGPVDVGDTPGEYIVGAGGCEAVSSAELVRITYFFLGDPGVNVEVDVTGTSPSSDLVNGRPVIANCDATIVPLTPTHFWENDLYAPGSLVINPDGTEVGTAQSTIGTIKARF